MSTVDGRVRLQINSVEPGFREWLEKNQRNDIWVTPKDAERGSVWDTNSCFDSNGAIIMGRVPSRMDSTLERTFDEVNQTIFNALIYYRLEYPAKPKNMHMQIDVKTQPWGDK